MGQHAEDGARYFSVVLCDRRRGNGNQQKHRQIQSDIQKNILLGGGKTLAWISQRGCGVTTLGDVQNPTDHSPDHPAVADPALRREPGLDDL